MSDRVWHKGPPRFTGWWNASVQKDEDAWRWWNGECWSWPVYDDETGDLVAANAALVSSDSPSWTDYWPENARVPRLDPTGGHWTFNVDGKEPNYEGPVDLAFRSGFKAPKSKILYGWLWSIEGRPGDIIAWRPAA